MGIDYEAMGERVRAERQKHGLSQEKLAELCNISISFLGHIERGTRKMSLETLVQLASTLNIGTDYLLFGKPELSDTTLVLLSKQLHETTPENASKLLNTIKVLSNHINEL